MQMRHSKSFSTKELVTVRVRNVGSNHIRWYRANERSLLLYMDNPSRPNRISSYRVRLIFQKKYRKKIVQQLCTSSHLGALIFK